jgi:hypothetical protein
MGIQVDPDSLRRVSRLHASAAARSREPPIIATAVPRFDGLIDAG